MYCSPLSTTRSTSTASSYSWSIFSAKRTEESCTPLSHTPSATPSGTPLLPSYSRMLRINASSFKNFLWLHSPSMPFSWCSHAPSHVFTPLPPCILNITSPGSSVVFRQIPISIRGIEMTLRPHVVMYTPLTNTSSFLPSNRARRLADRNCV
ncbi:hypothetical protein EBI_26795 [Enterocytozoon bieneusi H348]|nr:hypothetical protein EBI_26795 [Enterocytozoon bieneusi H348]|eukprot:XP_002652330.1 hypothetical protein EBI_26795 [Enterocytozoon bieneusi H348]